MPSVKLPKTTRGPARIKNEKKTIAAAPPEIAADKAGLTPSKNGGGEKATAAANHDLAKAERKRLLKAEKKRRKKERKARWGATKELAGTFPMVELIAEQVRTSIPEALVKRVKEAKNKKEVISASYPYLKCMKSSDYMEEVELLQIELVKMQAWIKTSGERIVMIFEGRDAAGKGGTIKRFTENLTPSDPHGPSSASGD